MFALQSHRCWISYSDGTDMLLTVVWWSLIITFFSRILFWCTKQTLTPAGSPIEDKAHLRHASPGEICLSLHEYGDDNLRCGWMVSEVCWCNRRWLRAVDCGDDGNQILLKRNSHLAKFRLLDEWWKLFMRVQISMRGASTGTTIWEVHLQYNMLPVEPLYLQIMTYDDDGSDSPQSKRI